MGLSFDDESWTFTESEPENRDESGVVDALGEELRSRLHTVDRAVPNTSSTDDSSRQEPLAGNSPGFGEAAFAAASPIPEAGDAGSSTNMPSTKASPPEPSGSPQAGSSGPSSPVPPPQASCFASGPRMRYYNIWQCYRAPHLVGMWCCVWRDLEALLPGGKLVCSGATLRGYSSRDEALSGWSERKRADRSIWPIRPEEFH
jgi:hypothetical protein